MATIWLFESDLVEQCARVMHDALDGLGCVLPHSVFLVGVHIENDEIVVVGAEPPVTAEDLEEEYLTVRDVFLPHPDNEEMLKPNLGPEYQNHDISCGNCSARIKDALESANKHPDRVFAISPCVDVHGYAVVLVVSYSKKAYDRYPTLDMSVFTEQGRTPALLFGAIAAVLDKFADELRKRDAGRYESDPPSGRGTLRTAGAFFTRVHAWHGKRFSPLDIEFRGTLELYDACNVISALPYESRVGLGGMIIAVPQHTAVDTLVQFQPLIKADNHKRVRKLLEMCKNGLCLLSDSRYIWGIGRFLADRYDASKHDVFRVQFVGHFRWEMWHLDLRLMVVQNGEPKMPMPRVDPEVLGNALRLRFSDITAPQVKQLIELVQLAGAQEHGTSIVVSPSAIERSDELSRGSAIRPFKPDADLLAGVTIDRWSNHVGPERNMSRNWADP